MGKGKSRRSSSRDTAETEAGRQASLLQARFDKFYDEGGEDFAPGNAYQSALAAGYSATTAKAKSHLLARRARIKTSQALEALGCDGFRVASKLVALMDAKTVKWNPGEEDWDVFEDNHIQLAATQEVNKVQDAYPAPKESGDHTPIQIVFPANFASLMTHQGAQEQKKPE